MEVVLSCEHAKWNIPKRFLSAFKGEEGILETHEGYDPGALHYAQMLQGALGCELVVCEDGRLGIEANRKGQRPANDNDRTREGRLYSRFTAALPLEDRQELFDTIYDPYVTKLHSAIYRARRRSSRVLHLSAHTLTDLLDGQVREADWAVLFDPSQEPERVFAYTSAEILDRYCVVALNFPYHGKQDAQITLTRQIPGVQSVAFEGNQKNVKNNKMDADHAQLISFVARETMRKMAHYTFGHELRRAA